MRYQKLSAANKMSALLAKDPMTLPVQQSGAMATQL
jgi:hypothetical protein